MSHVIMVIPASEKNNANTLMRNAEGPGGENTFTVGASVDGLPPYTHFVASHGNMDRSLLSRLAGSFTDTLPRERPVTAMSRLGFQKQQMR